MRELRRWTRGAICIGGLTAVFLLGSAAVVTAEANDQLACNSNSVAPDEGIAACSRRLTIRRQSKHNVVVIHYNRGNHWSKKGEYDRAISDYDQALRLDPNYESAYNNRGLAWANKREWDRAIADYDQAIRINPRRVLTLANRGNVYSSKKEFDRALRDYSEAIRVDPNYTTAYLSRGALYSDRGDFARALPDLDQGVRLSPTEAGPYNLRGFVLLRRGDLDRAIRDFDEALRLNPKFVTAYDNRGDAYFHKGEYDRAIRDYDEALWLNPRFVSGYLSRGGAYEKKGDHEKALRDYDEAIRLDPDLAVAHKSRSVVHVRKGNYARALADARESIRLTSRDRSASPSEYDVSFALANLLRERSDFTECAELYSRAMSLVGAPERRHWELYYGRGTCYERLKQNDRAEADFRQALELFPNQPQVLNYLGYVWMEQGKNFDEAFGMIRRAFEQRPDDGFIVDSLGWAYFRQGDFNTAIQHLERAAKMTGGNPTVYDHLGDAYWRAGRRGDAVARWSQARTRNPEPAELANIELKLRNGLPDEAPALRPRPPELTPPQIVAQPQSAPPPSTTAALGHRVALVIGNSTYRAVSKLVNPKRDAEAVAAAFRSTGFQTVRMENDLSRDKLVETLRAFGREAERADWAVVYFAGHGIEMSGVNYLVPVDARFETDRDVQYEAVPLEQVLGSVDGAKKLRLVILDACRDNPFANMKRTLASRSIGRGFGQIEPEGGVLVAYAAKHGHVALDGEGINSPFAASLIKHLPTPGIEVGKLFRLVSDDVLEATGRRQEPFTYGRLPGREDFYFVPPKESSSLGVK